MSINVEKSSELLRKEAFLPENRVDSKLYFLSFSQFSGKFLNIGKVSFLQKVQNVSKPLLLRLDAGSA